MYLQRPIDPKILLAAFATAAALGCHGGAPSEHAHDASHGHHDAHDDHDDVARGPHGGRLLEAGDLAVELAIHERGVPPRFHAYYFVGGKPVDPTGAELTVALDRLGGRRDLIELEPAGDHLASREVVEEPHSFDVTVQSRWRGESHEWRYASYEGRVELTPKAIELAGIVTETAGPATIETRLRVYGRVVPNEDALAHVIPRYPGIVKEVHKRLGDSVTEGETLAVIESNESLERYPVVAEIAGTIIKKHISPGEFAERGEDVYIVADLSTVWVDLNVYRNDFARLALGQRVTVRAGDEIEPGHGTIGYISPFGAESTQSMLARTVLENPDGRWKPGLFVSADIAIEQARVPVAVDQSALQTWRDWDVVFVRYGDVFEARPIEIGRRDDEWIEVVAGLEAGEAYVVENSFVLKADLGKSAATHEH